MQITVVTCDQKKKKNTKNGTKKNPKIKTPLAHCSAHAFPDTNKTPFFLFNKF